METFLDDLKHRGETINSAKSSSIRMTSRPKPSSNVRERAFDDLGSDFGGFKTQSKASSQASVGRGSSHQSTSKSSKARHTVIDDILGSGSSSDEFNVIDISTPGPRPKPTTLNVASMPGKSTSSAASSIAGITPQYHSRAGSLKHLKFKKNKTVDKDTIDSNAADASSSRRSPEITEQILVDGELYDFPVDQDSAVPKKAQARKASTGTGVTSKSTTASRQPKSVQPIPASLRKPFKPPSRVNDPPLATLLSSSPSGPSSPAPREVKRPNALFKTAPLAPPKPGSSRQTADTNGQKVLRSRSSILDINIDDLKKGDSKNAATGSETRPRPRPKGRKTDCENAGEEVTNRQELVPIKHKAREFPMEDLSPITGNRDDVQTPKARKVNKDKAKADGFPIFSPLSSQPSNSSLSRTSSYTASEFPPLSPLSSPPVKSSQSRRSKSGVKVHKGRIESTSECTSSSEEDDRKPRNRARPFPLGTQILESIGDSPLKRASEDDDPGTYRQKRRKRQGHEILTELMDSDAEDDMHFLDPNMDHSTLCPWCDEPLPPVPSPHLKSLIKTARKRSYQDPRPTNPLGLRAPLSVFVTVCQRHTFERIHMPLAQQKGWPTSISWEDVGPRVQRLENVLRRIIDDVDEEWLPGHARPSDEKNEQTGVEEENEILQRRRPRKGCIFWQDVIRNVKRHGLRQATGVRNQFSNFSKTQPGYYGELGYVIIHQTIYDLFPPTSFDPDSALPLTPTEFIQLILVPEAAVSLIMEDLQQTRAQAITTLRESAEYGVAMFPDDHNDAGVSVVEAGENIVRERAKARRKALEAEDEHDCESVPNVDHVPAVPVPRPRRRGKGRSKKDEDSDVAMLTDAPRSDVPETERHTVRKATPENQRPASSQTQPKVLSTEDIVDLCSSTDSMSVSKEPSQRRPKPRRRAMAQKPGSNSCNGAEFPLSDTDLSDLPDPGPNFLLARRGSRPENSDVEETPRPRRLGRSPVALPSKLALARTTVNKDNDKLTPLERARMRNRSTSSQQKDPWSRNLRDAGSRTNDSHSDSDASHASRDLRQRRGRSKICE